MLLLPERETGSLGTFQKVKLFRTSGALARN